MSALLIADKLSRRFGAHQAVADFSLELQRGEVLGLLGPNGAGKTTSLRMLSGCLAPQQGRILINGLDLQAQPQAARAQLGYLPETPPLHAELKVSEFLRFAARLRGISKSQLAAALDHVLQACSLDDVQHQVIGSLSKGYRQRVGLAQALIHRPALIILDEPTDGLDPRQLQQVRQLIRSLSQNHAVLLSSHMLSEVQAVCDRVALMASGRIVRRLNLHDPQEKRPLHLHLAQPPEAATLLAIPGVSAVEELGHGQFVLDCGAQDLRQTLARMAVSENWGLLELRRQLPSLETLFAESAA